MYKVFLVLLTLHNSNLSQVTPLSFSNKKENRIKIGVIDTGIVNSKEMFPFLCKGNHYDFTGTSIEDTYNHGTNVAWILKSYINPKTHCLQIFKWYSKDGSNNNLQNSIDAINKAIIEKVKYLNLSYGGDFPDRNELNVVKQALDKGIIISAAAGNESKELSNKHCNYFPACYKVNNKNFHVTGALDSQGGITSFSNYGELVTDWNFGELQCEGYDRNGKPICLKGTSQATPRTLGKLIGK